jgi:tRNA(Ile)-lysidine synthase
MSDTLLRAVAHFLQTHHLRDQLVIVGVSGGADSLALAHVLWTLRARFALRLRIAHLNHQLRGKASEEDARFVEELARQWNLPATIESHDVAAFARAQKLSVEEAARMVRYGFLEQVAEREGARAVAVAHQADDQVETIVMHFIRGAGLAGLRGMQPVAQYPLRPPMRLLRPLLTVTRAEIDAYCAAHQLTPRVDATNTDTTLLRNRIRHELIPLLETYNPNIGEALRRNARLMSDDYDYLQQRALGQWERTRLTQTKQNIAFSLSGWRTLTPSLKRALIRLAVKQLRPQLRRLDAQHVENALQISNRGRVGARATLPAGLCLFCDFDAIVIAETLDAPALPRMPPHPLPLKTPGLTHLDSDWICSANIFLRDELPADALQGIDPLEAFFDADKAQGELVLRGRESHDVFKPLGLQGHSKPLRRFMIDAKIPAHWRDLLPLVVRGADVIWIAGWRIAETVKIDEHTQRVLSLKFTRSDKE